MEDFSTIDAIYILDPSGIPLFARYYHGEMADTDTTLLGGFFSALEIFVKTSLDGLLTDIGLTGKRFFFDRTDSSYILIIIVGTTSGTIDADTLKLVNHLQNVINLCFSVVVKTVKENMMSIEAIVENLGSTIDSFLLESNFEFFKDELSDAEFSTNIRSEPLDPDDLIQIISHINEFR